MNAFSKSLKDKFSIIWFLALIIDSVAAGDYAENSILEGWVVRIELSNYVQFKNFQYDLMYLVAHAKRNSQANNFCLVGYRWPNGAVRAAVNWKEESYLYIWSGRRIVPEEYGDYASSLIMSDSIDLKHSVVDREDQMAMSTYLRRDVEGTLEDCAKHGVEYELKPFTPPSPKDMDDW
ncbi:hypothetical protein [Pseudomonas mangiferae]|uniref:Uncharacterized protein n=1 Tax=Pseudomonas mangiferae TaxID=2593654 RepID=A0A553GW50_9PSED|nr:hypothetical protein [Pseudomonas mangiferae]TRX73683.1 hypothetical protein FM069_16245 [Pseudomonas mangiferae]